MREEKKRGRGETKTYKNKSKRVDKMAVSIYILIITLKVTGLNAPTKDIDWLNGYKNKTHTYAIYK